MTRVVIDLREAKKRLRGKEIRPAPVVAQLALAEEMAATLERGGVNRTGLAHLYGLTKARVTQLLNLLKLHPLILNYLRSLGGGRPRAWVTERRLRGLAAMEPAAQLGGAVKGVPGFAAALTENMGTAEQRSDEDAAKLASHLGLVAGQVPMLP